MNTILERIKQTFDSKDLIIKKIRIKKNCYIYIIYLESLSSSNKVNDYILKGLIKKFDLNNLISEIPGPNTKSINLDEINFHLENGFSIILNNEEIIAVETRADISRAVATPDSEPSLNGPKDAFNENYQINIGLIKRRLKTSSLRTDNFTIGRRTKTNVGLLYIDDIAEEKIINNIKDRINNIDIDGIIDASYLALLLEKDSHASFPTIMKTERPDVVCAALLEGKIAIVVDTSCFVLLLPAFFADFINPQSDNYSKSHNINFVKILRLTCFFISMIFPAFYIAIINYNQEAIPTSLLINFSIQRDGVPFPAIVEAAAMICLCEILRESDLRFPNAYGSAISILGALVLGQAAVSAGIVSPIMIIVIATTFISSLIFTEYELINALRHYRFAFLFSSSLFGIFGLVLALIYFLIRINDISSFSKPYFFPIAPFEKTYFFKTLFKAKIEKNTNRSDMLTNKDDTKLKNG